LRRRAGALALAAVVVLATGSRSGDGRPDVAHAAAAPVGSPEDAARVPLAYLEGPLPGRTGGFGEPTCRECHFSFELNPPGGQAVIEGLPDRWTPGRTYVLTVRLRHEELERGGFQLSARRARDPGRGRNAGVLRSAGRRTQVVRDTAPGSRIRYVQHTAAGSGPVAGDSVTWEVTWKAPPADSAGGPVVFHLAANAANDDNSEFGDRIYAAERTVQPTSKGESVESSSSGSTS